MIVVCSGSAISWASCVAWPLLENSSRLSWIHWAQSPHEGHCVDYPREQWKPLNILYGMCALELVVWIERLPLSGIYRCPAARHGGAGLGRIPKQAQKHNTLQASVADHQEQEKGGQ